MLSTGLVGVVAAQHLLCQSLVAVMILHVQQVSASSSSSDGIHDDVHVHDEQAELARQAEEAHLEYLAFARQAKEELAQMMAEFEDDPEEKRILAEADAESAAIIAEFERFGEQLCKEGDRGCEKIMRDFEREVRTLEEKYDVGVAAGAAEERTGQGRGAQGSSARPTPTTAGSATQAAGGESTVPAAPISREQRRRDRLAFLDRIDPPN